MMQYIGSCKFSVNEGPVVLMDIVERCSVYINQIMCSEV